MEERSCLHAGLGHVKAQSVAAESRRTTKFLIVWFSSCISSPKALRCTAGLERTFRIGSIFLSASSSSSVTKSRFMLMSDICTSSLQALYKCAVDYVGCKCVICLYTSQSCLSFRNWGRVVSRVSVLKSAVMEAFATAAGWTGVVCCSFAYCRMASLWPKKVMPTSVRESLSSPVRERWLNPLSKNDFA